MNARLSLIALLALAAIGCMRAQARTVPDMPPLDVPPPPPRVVEVSEPASPPAIGGLVEEPARNAPARPRTTTATPRPDTAKPEAPKPEPPIIADLPRPPEEPATRPQPSATLQTTPTQREAELEREIREMVRRANADLNRVDYQRLNTPARSQYDSAKAFMRQADEALKERNLVFARTVADKAMIIAAQLLGR